MSTEEHTLTLRALGEILKTIRVVATGPTSCTAWAGRLRSTLVAHGVGQRRRMRQSEGTLVVSGGRHAPAERSTSARAEKGPWMATGKPAVEKVSPSPLGVPTTSSGHPQALAIAESPARVVG